MAAKTLQVGSNYSVGTSVKAYPAANWLVSALPPSGSPVGSSTTQPTLLRGPTITGIGKAFSTGMARACASVASQTNISADVTFADGVNAFWFGAY